MTMPDGDGTYALLVQIIAEQAKQGATLAVIQARLESIPDHESRLRVLERWRWSVPASLTGAAGSVLVSVATWLAHH